MVKVILTKETQPVSSRDIFKALCTIARANLAETFKHNEDRMDYSEKNENYAQVQDTSRGKNPK